MNALDHFRKGEQLLADSSTIPSNHDETNPAATLMIQEARAHFEAAQTIIAALNTLNVPAVDHEAWAEIGLAPRKPAPVRAREFEDVGGEASPHAHLIGKRIAVYTDDYGRETGTLTSARPHGVTVRVDRVIGGAPNRDYRDKDITRLEQLHDSKDEQDGGAAGPSVYEDMGVRDAIRSEVTREDGGDDRG